MGEQALLREGNARKAARPDLEVYRVKKVEWFVLPKLSVDN